MKHRSLRNTLLLSAVALLLVGCFLLPHFVISVQDRARAAKTLQFDMEEIDLGRGTPSLTEKLITVQNLTETTATSIDTGILLSPETASTLAMKQIEYFSGFFPLAAFDPYKADYMGTEPGIILSKEDYTSFVVFECYYTFDRKEGFEDFGILLDETTGKALSIDYTNYDYAVEDFLQEENLFALAFAVGDYYEFYFTGEYVVFQYLDDGLLFDFIYVTEDGREIGIPMAFIYNTISLNTPGIIPEIKDALGIEDWDAFFASERASSVYFSEFGERAEEIPSNVEAGKD